MGTPWARSAIWREWMHWDWEESQISKRGQCYNHQDVGHETRFSKDYWEYTYFKIFWKSWNRPSYSTECLRYWLLWHLVVETTSLTLKQPESASQYCLLWMWRHFGTRHSRCLSEPTDYQNSPASGSEIQYIVRTIHSSQHKMKRRLSSMSCNYWGYSDFGPCGWWRGVQSHCITLSQCTMTCSIAWMALRELWLRRRHNRRMTWSWPWSLLDRG